MEKICSIEVNVCLLYSNSVAGLSIADGSQEQFNGIFRDNYFYPF